MKRLAIALVTLSLIGASNLAFAAEHRWDRCVSEYIKLYEAIKEAN